MSKTFKLPLPIVVSKSYIDPSEYRCRIGKCRLIFGLLISPKFRFFLKPIFAWRPLDAEHDPYDSVKNAQYFGLDWESKL